MTGSAGDIQDRYEKIKNVFRFLIQHAPYLVDDKTYEASETVDMKQQFQMKIDSVRRSLGIDNMDDVKVLVDTLYGFQDHWEL